MRTIRAALTATLLAAAGLGLAPAPAGASTNPCAAITQGRVYGLTARPGRVTFALASGYGSTYARLVECTRTSTGAYAVSWQTTARVGSRGFASPGAKREGDGRSPSGVYAFGTGFGAANPDSGLGYWTLTPTSCWGSTVGSALYNRRYTGTCRPADERMYSYVTGAYRQGAVINYNTNPVVQGAGSAIFFHVGTGGPTAGCVSADYATVVRKLRASRPGDLISMGVGTGRIRLYTPDTITHTLAAGSAYDSEVRALQRRLNQHGYGLAVDGIYGSGTTRAVRAAQTARRLPATGVADYPIAHALELR